MTPVYSQIIDKYRGDCLRASIASLFDLEIIQVPHFRLFDEITERFVLSGFYWAMGYDLIEYGKPYTHTLNYEDSVSGLFVAGVHSSYGKDFGHAVLIDTNGIVVHDPNKLFHGINALEVNILVCWPITKKQNRENWK